MKSKRNIVAVFGMLFLWLPSLAAQNIGADEDLTNAERLSLRFRSYPELSGDYRVSSDGFISLPVMGRVSVVRMNAEKLEKALTSLVGEIVHREGEYVTVEVAAYRPVFLTGAVKNSGPVPWQPGLTVLQAVALAGGSPIVAGADFGGTLSSSRKSTYDLVQSLAILARLEAEDRGDMKIGTPSKLIGIASQESADQAMKVQSEIMEGRRKSFATQLATLNRAKEYAAREEKGLREQLARLQEQLQARREYRQRLQELVMKGTVTAVRGLEEDIKVTDLEERVTNITVGIARVQSTISSIDRDTELLKFGRETDIKSEIIRREREVVQLSIDIESVRGTLDKEVNSNQLTTEKPGTNFSITRARGDGFITFPADRLTGLKPGDVVEISFGRKQ